MCVQCPSIHTVTSQFDAKLCKLCKLCKPGTPNHINFMPHLTTHYDNTYHSLPLSDNLCSCLNERQQQRHSFKCRYFCAVLYHQCVAMLIHNSNLWQVRIEQHYTWTPETNQSLCTTQSCQLQSYHISLNLLRGVQLMRKLLDWYFLFKFYF